MRQAPLLAILALTACAHLGASAPPIVISDDGQVVTAGGERWTAPPGASFYQRGSVVHVVSTAPGREWEVVVPLGPDGRLEWPGNAPFEPSDGALRLHAGAAAPGVEALIEAGELHPHDDHYHLTHRFRNEDWQALYRLRAEDSPLPPIRRQVAATILALLLDERIPGATPEATDAAMRRMTSIIGKARRAIEGDVGARAIETIITWDLEIRDEGRTLDLGGQLFHAQDPVRFAYCAGHFHVEDAGGKWAQPIELEGQVPGAFAWPRSIFFEARPDGTVAERPGSPRWKKLVDGGEIKFARDHWHVTESYPHPGLKRILAIIADDGLAEPLRDRARAAALDVMRLRLDLGSEAELEARLDAIGQVIDRAAEELEKDVRAAPAPKPKR